MRLVRGTYGYDPHKPPAKPELRLLTLGSFHLGKVGGAGRGLSIAFRGRGAFMAWERRR